MPNQIVISTGRSKMHLPFQDIRIIGLSVLASLSLALDAMAQTSSFDDFQAQVTAKAAEIEKYQRVLQNPDMRIQYEAVQYMLKSKDPALQRIAKEHALFSTNPVLRNSAIKSILDAGGNIRLEITASGQESADVLRWLTHVGGSHDGAKGGVIFQIGEARGDCWIQYRDSCQFRLAGTNVLFQHRGNAIDIANAQLALGNDGVLRGIIFTNKATGKAFLSIDLKE